MRSYGIDAPHVVRYLVLFSLLALGLVVFSFQIRQTPWFWILFLYSGTAFFTLFSTGCWMLFSSWITKPHIISRLIEKLQLEGNETVLDVGCGRGAFSIKVAKRLSQGKVIGIDLWSSKDQSGNRIENILANAQVENVRERIEIHTGDMRSLPYPDNFFDVVISSLAIHNIPEKEGRHQVLSEILRVLKPKGKFCLLDIFYGKNYAHFFQKTGKVEVSCSSSIYFYCPFIRIIHGKKDE